MGRKGWVTERVLKKQAAQRVTVDIGNYVGIFDLGRGFVACGTVKKIDYTKTGRAMKCIHVKIKWSKYGGLPFPWSDLEDYPNAKMLYEIGKVREFDPYRVINGKRNERRSDDI